MANQMMPQINLLQMPDPSKRTAQYANMMNMASQQRAAQLQGERTRQEMEYAKAAEQRDVDKFGAEQPVRVAGALGGGLINILRDPSDASIMQAAKTFAAVGMEPDKFNPILQQIMDISDPNARKLFVTQFVAQSEAARAALNFVMPKSKEIKAGDDTVFVDDNPNSENYGQELFRINVAPEQVRLSQNVVGEKLFNTNPLTGVAAEAVIGDPNQGLTPARRTANLSRSGATSRYAVGGGGAGQPRMEQPVTPTAPAAVGVQTSRGAPGTGKDTFKIMIGMESGGKQFDRNGRPLTSPKGAIGIAQIMPATAPEAAKLAGLPYDVGRLKNDEAYNLALGEAYFEKQLRDFGGDPRKAAAAYNAGPGALRRAIAKGGPDGWINHVPRETQRYVAQIPGGGGAAPASSASNAAPAGAGTPTGTGTGTPLTVSESVKLPGKERVSRIISDMIKEYDILNDAKAIPSSQRGALENIFDYVSVSGPGKEIQKAFGSKANDSLSNITNARKLLTSAIAAATGMSSKQMDSNRELQLTLDSLSDPTQGYKAVTDTLMRIDREYGMGTTTTRTPTGGDTKVIKTLTPDQVRAAPSGTVYRTTDGRRLTKP
jgi:hypothetical protein